jgi:hypothetical protein
MNEKKQVDFIPFHAINEFMRNDFRLNVIRSTLAAMVSLDRELTAPIDRLTRKHVKVAGFRNSIKAPTTVKAVGMVRAFEKQPKLVAAILNAWTHSKGELQQQIYQFLIDRGWKLLPIEADRTKIPGFLTRWPEGEDYETLYQDYIGLYPESEASIDETSLMIVWLSGRLPIEKVRMEIIQETEDPEKTANVDNEA